MEYKASLRIRNTYYRKYPNLVRTQVEIIFDPNYSVCILIFVLF